MLADIFFKASAVLALAAMTSAAPASLEVYSHDDFKSEMLAAHNFYRVQHSALPLAWDDDLAANAAAWASQCSWDHQPNNNHGENLASGTGWFDWTNLWGGERVYYNWDKPGFTSETGHFTQVVWKSTTKLGCAWVECSDEFNVVCEYDPPGNIIGNNNQYFRRNVGTQVSGNPGDTYQG